MVFGKEKNAVDSTKHRDLWNMVVSGTPKDAVIAAGKLYELGDKIFVLATTIASTERKGGKSK